MSEIIPNWYLKEHPETTYEEWKVKESSLVRKILSYREGYTDESPLTKQLEAQVDQLTKENAELRAQLAEMRKIIE